MNHWIGTLNDLASLWGRWTWSVTWQASVVTGVIFLALWFGHRWSSPIRYAILLVALLKFAMPPLVPAPAGVFSWAGPRVERASWNPALPLQVSGRESGTGPVMRSPARASGELTEPASTKRALPGVEVAQGRDVRTPATAPRPQLGWSAICMMVHGAGALGVFGWLVLQWTRLSWIRRGAFPTLDQEVRQEFNRLAGTLGFRHPPGLLVSREISSPVAFGVLRPFVLLPETLVMSFSIAELRPVLAHELAHILRRDLWVNALQSLLLACWWFHPAFWALHRAVRRTREDCCDDLLLARGLTSSEAYCNVLIRTAREIVGREVNSLALGLGENLHPLGRRLRRIMDRSLGRSPRLSFGGTLFALVTAGLLLPGLRSEESKTGKAVAAKPQPNLATDVPAGAQPAATLDKLFGSLRWVAEENLFCDKMRSVSLQMGSNAVPYLLTKLELNVDDPDDAKAADARRHAAMALGFIGADLERVVPKLVQALEDEADLTFQGEGMKVHLVRVASAAADALGNLGPGAFKALPALLESAQFGNGRALVALAKIAPNSPDVLGALTNAVADFTKPQRLPQEGEYRLHALAALSMAAKASPEALIAFIRSLDDGDPRFRSMVARQLIRLRPDSLEADRRVTELLEKGTSRQRAWLAAALAQAGVKDDRTRDILVRRLREENPEYLQTCVEGLGSFGERAAVAVPIIARLAKSNEGELRLAALQALQQIGVETPEVSGAVLANMNANDETLRTTAIASLTRLRRTARQAEPVLFELLGHPDAIVRQAAANALGEVHASPEQAIPALKAALADSGYGVASSALTSLGKFPEAAEQLLPIFIQAMTTTNAWAAAIALGDLGPRAALAVPDLTRALTNTLDGTRNNSAFALGKIGPSAKDALPALENALNDAESGVRRNAAMALWRIAGRTNVVGVLMERLKSEDALDVLERLNLKSSRLWDLKELGEIGLAARPALPLLVSLASGKDDDLRAAAERAIERIGADRP